MIYPELRDIRSSDVLPPSLPSDPSDCAIRFVVRIGASQGGGNGTPEEHGVESFAFVAVTAGRLAQETDAVWGRGFLILPVFSWEAFGTAVAGLLARSARPSWTEVVGALSTELCWVPSMGEAPPDQPSP